MATMSEYYSKMIDRNRALVGGSDSSLDYWHLEDDNYGDQHMEEIEQQKLKNDKRAATKETRSEAEEEQMQLHDSSSGKTTYGMQDSKTFGKERMRRSRKRSPTPNRSSKSPSARRAPREATRDNAITKKNKRPYTSTSNRRAGSRDRKRAARTTTATASTPPTTTTTTGVLHSFELSAAVSAQASANAAASLAAVAARMALGYSSPTEEEQLTQMQSMHHRREQDDYDDAELRRLIAVATSASRVAVDAAEALSLEARALQKQKQQQQIPNLVPAHVLGY